MGLAKSCLKSVDLFSFSLIITIFTNITPVIKEANQFSRFFFFFFFLVGGPLLVHFGQCQSSSAGSSVMLTHGLVISKQAP